MSVDNRLRQARPEDDTRWEAALDLTLAGVVRNARRRRTRHAVVAAGAVAAVLAVGGLAIGLTNDSDPQPAPALPSPTTPTTNSLPAVTSPVDGEWHTRRLDRQQVLTSLEAAGVGTTVAEDFVTGLPEGTFRYRMLISRGIVQARVNHQASIFQLILAVNGRSLTMTPNASVFGHWTFDYNLDGDRLTLQQRRSTVPDYAGFTSRVHGLAMFTVAPFTRAD